MRSTRVSTSHRGPVAWGRRSAPRRQIAVVLFLLCALAASPALGIVPGNTDPNLFTGSWAGMDWSYLYRWRNGTAVAVDDFWVLTVSHMGAAVGDSIDVGGQTYFVEQVQRCPPDWRYNHNRIYCKVLFLEFFSWVDSFILVPITIIRGEFFFSGEPR